MEEPIAVDIGNENTKLAQGERLAVGASQYAEILSESEIGELDPDSAYVHYLGGTREDLVGKKWLVGKAASTNCPDSFQRVVDYANNRGKPALGLQLLLGMLRPKASGEVINITDLFTSLPDCALLSAEMKRAFTGSHHAVLGTHKGQLHYL